jgi:hypothetical protein
MSFYTIKNILIVSKFYSFKDSDSKFNFLRALVTNIENLQNDILLCVIVDEMPKNVILIIKQID